MVKATYRDDIAAEFAAAAVAASLNPEKADQILESAVDIALVAMGATATDQQGKAVPEAYLRKEQRIHEVSLEEQFNLQGGVLQRDADLILTMTSKNLVKYVLKAHLTDRQALIMFCYYEGKNQRDTAKEAGCSLGTVNAELRAGFNALRATLPSDPYWNIVEHLLEVFGARLLSLAERI